MVSDAALKPARLAAKMILMRTAFLAAAILMIGPTEGEAAALAAQTGAHGAALVETVVAQGYANGNINSVSMARNNLISVGGYQFAAFYGPAVAGRVPVMIARRKAGGDRWQVATTAFSLEDVFSNTGARDDHNIIAMGVDKLGHLHLAWGMHNAPLAYAISRGSVLGRGFVNELAFAKAQMIGENEDAVTYPEFFHTPRTGALMFAYRNGGAGGGSGNGNQYLNAYSERRWVRIADPMVDGISTSMNAYMNSFAYNRRGELFASWTIRESPDWQTNHDVYLARSLDGGRSWIAADGKSLGKTIDRKSADDYAKIISLPIRSSLINQTSMTVDVAGNPLIATWWAPEAAAGNHSRQYMLIWKDSKGWRTSQISDRAPGEPQDVSSAAVRQMGRPLVLVDRSNRVVVVARSSDAGKPVEDASNRLKVYWSTDRVHWSSRELSSVNPGAWEPSYDQALWQSQNKLSLLFEPSGLGAPTAQISVLTWDERAFFADPLRKAASNAGVSRQEGVPYRQ